MNFEMSSSSLIDSSPLASSSPQNGSLKHWVLQAKAMASQTFEKRRQALEKLKNKLNNFDELKKIKFCSIDDKEDADLGEILKPHIAKVVKSEPTFEDDIENHEFSIDIEETNIIKKEPDMSQFVPIIRRMAPIIELPMSDGKIFNIVVKEEILSLPDLNEEGIEKLEKAKEMIEKIIEFNKKL